VFCFAAYAEVASLSDVSIRQMEKWIGGGPNSMTASELIKPNICICAYIYIQIYIYIYIHIHIHIILRTRLPLDL